MTAAVILSAFAFVAIVDPYDNLAFSPPWKRYRVTTNERYAFPGLIRHGRFDSAVFGTSTMMLLKPEELDKMVGGRFANLAMSYGTPWEQSQLIKFFDEHAREPVHNIVVGIDMDWCSPAKPMDRLTPHPFPPWEYDDDPWNDYAHLLNTRALLHAVREVLMFTIFCSPISRTTATTASLPTTVFTIRRERMRLSITDAGRRPSPISAYADPPPVGARPSAWTFPRPAVAGTGARWTSRADAKNPGVRAPACEPSAGCRGVGEIHPLQGSGRRYREDARKRRRHRFHAAHAVDPQRLRLLGIRYTTASDTRPRSLRRS